jgi:hypothetical protein
MASLKPIDILRRVGFLKTLLNLFRAIPKLSHSLSGAEAIFLASTPLSQRFFCQEALNLTALPPAPLKKGLRDLFKNHP